MFPACCCRPKRTPPCIEPRCKTCKNPSSGPAEFVPVLGFERQSPAKLGVQGPSALQHFRMLSSAWLDLEACLRSVQHRWARGRGEQQ